MPNTISRSNARIVQNIQAKIQVANSGSHPAVLLGGGSNVIIGLDADTMGRLLKRPVYNLGLVNEGGDYRNVLALLEASARPGDTVVISSRGFYGNPITSHKSIAVKVAGRSIYIAESAEVLNIPNKSIARLLMPQQNLGADPYEQLMRLHMKGDRNMCTPKVHSEIAKLDPTQWPVEEYVQHHAEFLNTMRTRGVAVYFSAPDILVSRDDWDSWTARHLDIRQKIERIGGHWISVPMERVLSTSIGDFCDSSLHPSEQRALQRTQMVAKALASELQ